MVRSFASLIGAAETIESPLIDVRDHGCRRLPLMSDCACGPRPSPFRNVVSSSVAVLTVSPVSAREISELPLSDPFCGPFARATTLPFASTTVRNERPEVRAIFES